MDFHCLHSETCCLHNSLSPNIKPNEHLELRVFSTFHLMESKCLFLWSRSQTPRIKQQNYLHSSGRIQVGNKGCKTEKQPDSKLANWWNMFCCIYPEPWNIIFKMSRRKHFLFSSANNFTCLLHPFFSWNRMWRAPLPVWQLWSDVVSIIMKHYQRTHCVFSYFILCKRYS